MSTSSDDRTTPDGDAGKRTPENPWASLLVGLIGATATIFAFTRSQSSWRNGGGDSFWSSFREAAVKIYNRRIQKAHEEELERLERIRQMQNVFNKARNKYIKDHENWMENDAHTQQFREDRYWKTDTTNKDQRTNFRESLNNARHLLTDHYSVLGLDRLRTEPYTDDEIKAAFRSKAMEFHPDQNQDKKEVAEAKFREVIASYEAIKTERENQKP